MHKIIRITTVPISLYKLLEGQLNFINNYYEVIAISSPEAELYKCEKKEGIKTYGVKMSRRITPLADIFSIISLIKIFRKEQPSIVHTHTPKAGLVGMIAAKISGVPNRFHTVAGLPLMESKGFKKVILILVEILTYKCSTKIYPNSFGLRDFILDNKLSKHNKIKVLANGSSNGINLDYFSLQHFNNINNSKFRLSINISKTDFVFIFVGRLVGDKGVNELIKSFSNLSNGRTNLKLILLGNQEKSLDPLLNDTVNEINYNKNIISLGFKDDVRPYLAISNALVFPSYREGFPNAVLQAAAMELPSIVTNINGCNEIIENGINGILIPVKNIEELTKSMKLICEDINYYKSLKKNCRKVIVEKFKREFVWKSILHEYDNCLSHKN
jgi:glycosyltransferase involved in cell wall biosynthesis